MSFFLFVKNLHFLNPKHRINNSNDIYNNINFSISFHLIYKQSNSFSTPLFHTICFFFNKRLNLLLHFSSTTKKKALEKKQHVTNSLVEFLPATFVSPRHMNLKHYRVIRGDSRVYIKIYIFFFVGALG